MINMNFIRDCFKVDTDYEKRTFVEFVVVSTAAVLIGLVLVLVLLKWYYLSTGGITCRGLLCWLLP